MDVILVNPRNPSMDKENYDSVYHRGLEMIPLGLFYIATVLEMNNYRTAIYDFNTANNEADHNEYLEKIVREKPAIVGISSTTTTYPAGKEIVQYLKARMDRNTVFVWGGLHVTFLPEEPIREGIADAVVRGEGEDAMLSLVHAIIEKHGDVSQVPGVSYAVNEKIIHNSPEVLRIGNLDRLPIPRRDYVDLARYRNAGTIIVSRGCIARCQFCAAGRMGNIVMRSIENITREIRELFFDYNLHHICFVDNTFIASKKKAFGLFEKLADEDVKARYSIESRASVVDEEYLKKLGEWGVFAIHYGVETGSSRILSMLNKNISLEQVENAVNLALKYNYEIACSFIIGLPEDTPETVKHTIQFAKNLTRKGVVCYFAPLTPFPGTDVFIRRKELGVEIVDWDYSHWDMKETVIRTKNLTKKEIANSVRQAYAENLAI